MKKLKVIIITNNTKEKILKNFIEKSKNYFVIESISMAKEDIKKATIRRPDFLILDRDNASAFKGLYSNFKRANNGFKLLYISNKVNPKKDIDIFKKLFDDIIYLEDERLAYWKFISLLRRRWDDFSTGSTILYKNIVVDFLNSFVSVDGKEVTLTSKELKLFRYFLINNGKYISKNQIFKDVWKVQDNDTTRSVDQMIFKLKRKIGKEFFKSSRQKGFKFE